MPRKNRMVEFKTGTPYTTQGWSNRDARDWFSCRSRPDWRNWLAVKRTMNHWDKVKVTRKNPITAQNRSGGSPPWMRSIPCPWNARHCIPNRRWLGTLRDVRLGFDARKMIDWFGLMVLQWDPQKQIATFRPLSSTEYKDMEEQADIHHSRNNNAH